MTLEAIAKQKQRDLQVRQVNAWPNNKSGLKSQSE